MNILSDFTEQINKSNNHIFCGQRKGAFNFKFR